MPSEILSIALQERPTSQQHRRATWHVGNVDAVNGLGCYFRLGRKSVNSVPFLDETGDFIDGELEHAPYTHCVIAPKLGLCAFARNAALAVTTATMANRLLAVLSQSAVARERDVALASGPVSNPDTFLSLLAKAHAIRSFKFTFQRRNPFDANVDFVKPLERLVEFTNGAAGQATIKGQDLLAAPLAELTRSVAATGDDATARVMMSPGAKTETRHLRGDTASVSVDSLDTMADREEVLRQMKAAHARIRGAGDVHA